MPRLDARMRSLRLVAPVAIALAGGGGTAAANAMQGNEIKSENLPSGDSDAFRRRMMSWSASPLPQSNDSSPRPEPDASRATDLPRLSSGFGVRTDPLRGTFARHAGVDIPAPLGTPVLASAEGMIRFAGSAGGYGNMVEIEHPNGIRTRYAHLSRILVGERSTVARGQIIALMGSTGRSTGSHLHFEMRANGTAIDPLPHLGEEEVTTRAVRIAPLQPFQSAFARARAAAAPDEDATRR